jgi:FAD/FMN-containing dehydrogenase
VIGRRHFLGLGGAAVAGTALYCPGAASPGGPSDADWDGLERSLSGELVRLGGIGYDAARLVFNARFDEVRPQALVQARTVDDVRQALGFVRRFGLAVTSRSGGHSYAGHSTGRGLVIDVGPMNDVAVEGDRAVVGAGARLHDVYGHLLAHGVCIPSGTCGGVGIAGITMGGGIGLLHRVHGLTCDALLAARVVTAEGEVRECDVELEPDLFWALRGGGGGNFGIVTSFTFRTHPVRAVERFGLVWHDEEPARVLEAWQRWAPTLPDDVWSASTLWAGDPPPARMIASINGVSLGDRARLGALLGDLVGAVGRPPTARTQQTLSFRELLLDHEGCGSFPGPECASAPGRRALRPASTGSSDLFDDWVPAEGVAALVQGVRARHESGEPAVVLLDLLGGVVGGVPRAATAFVHRPARFVAQYLVTYPTGAPADRLAAAGAWAHGMRAVMRPWSSGRAYQNYLDPQIVDWPAAYYGDNYARLVRVKAQYDPGQVFRFPQGIPPR